MESDQEISVDNETVTQENSTSHVASQVVTDFEKAIERNKVYLPRGHKMPWTLNQRGPAVTKEYMNAGATIPHGYSGIVLGHDWKGPVFVAKE